jgi:HEAT repeat protein
VKSTHRSTNNGEEKKDLGASIIKIKKIREIGQLLAKTSSQMKIFASDHSNIQKFSDELYGKINNYLEKHWKLELGVEECAFTFQGKPVYEDDQIKKSLPFLFFKDGIQTLFFYKDMGKNEFFDFLEIIKHESALPAEESDIVISLWEKDFTNIRCVASDEFLESKIGIGMEPLEYQIDRTTLTTGKIELIPEDWEALNRVGLNDALLTEKKDESRDALAEIAEEDIASIGQPLSDEEIETLEAMIDSNRRITSEDELIALIIEMLYLEEREEPFAETIRALDENHHNLLEKGNFARATHLLYLLLELKKNIENKSDTREYVIKGFLEKIRGDEALADLQRNVQEKKISDANALLKYLQILGPVSIPVLSQLYDQKRNPQLQAEVLKSIKELGRLDLAALMRIAQDERPSITNAIISVLSDSEDRRAIQHLATFINYKNESIKSEAIKALGKQKDETANRILMAFLKDEEKEFRILAAQNLLYIKDQSVEKYILNTVKDKNFRKKTAQETRAFIELLGRIKTEESCAILMSFLKRPGISFWTKKKEVSLHAVSGLEIMGTPEAIKILEAGSRLHSRTIREACKNSLQKLSSNAPQNPGVKK